MTFHPYQFPWDTTPATVPGQTDPAAADEPQTKTKKPLGRRPAAPTKAMARTTATKPDWLYHRLLVSGQGETVAAFVTAAHGAGVIPWRLDFAA